MDKYLCRLIDKYLCRLIDEYKQNVDWALSLEIRPLAALYPPPINIFQTDTIERGANLERSSRSQPSRHFFVWGGGYNAAKGLIYGRLPQIDRQIFKQNVD